MACGELYPHRQEPDETRCFTAKLAKKDLAKKIGQIRPIGQIRRILTAMRLSGSFALPGEPAVST